MALLDELDLFDASTVEDALRLCGRARRDIVVDLSQPTFMDCAGLAVLLRARVAAGAHGHRLIVDQVSRPVARLLALTGTDDLLAR